VSEQSEKYVLDYLDKVADEAQRRIRQPSERIKLVEDLRDRIAKAAARRGNQPKAVRKILVDLGPAERQVDEFLARHSPGVPAAPARPAPAEAARAQVPPRAEVRPRPEPSSRPEVRPRSEPGAPPEVSAPAAATVQPEAPPRAELPPPTAPRPETAGPDISRAEAARSAAEAETRPINIVPGPPAPPPTVRTAERPRVTLGDLPAAVLVAAVLLVVAVVTLLFGWFGWVALALVALRWPPAARGVRVVSLIFIPLFSLPFFLLIGLASDVNEVMGRVYPFGIGVLGAAFLLWGTFRYPRPRAAAQPQPTERPPRRPQRRAYRGLSRQNRG
jgi:hypothetical protein